MLEELSMKNYRRLTAALAAVVLSLNTALLCVSAEFVTEDGKTYYYDENDEKVTGLQEIGGETYYFDRKGVMQTGWQTVLHKYKCYFRKDGTMVKGKARIGGKSYYFNEKGYMQTGNVIIGSEIYLYGDDGAMVKQYKNTIVTVNGKKYCPDSKGKMQTGLVKVGSDNYYFFCDEGYAISAEVEKDGYIYEVDKDIGLISKTKKPTDPSKINVKIEPYTDTAITLIGFKFSNNSKGTKLSFSGYITNSCDYDGCKVTLTLQMFDADGCLIDQEVIARTPRLSTGEQCKVTGSVSTTEPVYSVKFIIKRT